MICSTPGAAAALSRSQFTELQPAFLAVVQCLQQVGQLLTEAGQIACS